MKLMFLTTELLQTQLLQHKGQEYSNPSLADGNLFQQLYSKLYIHFKNIKLVDKNPDLIIFLSKIFDNSSMMSALSTYPNVRKIMICDEDIDARGYYYDRTKHALLKLSNALHLNKHVMSQMEQIRIRLRKGKNKYSHQNIRAFVENSKSHEFSVLTNDFTNAKTQRESDQTFNYPYFMRWNNHLKKIMKAHKEKGENNRQKRQFCCYIQRSHTPERKILLDTLSRYKKVDCYGTAGYNNPNIAKDPYKTLINGGRGHAFSDNDRIYQHYKFVIAFENSIADGYVTEKITIPMSANAIPLYWGTPSVNKYFNPDSFLSYDNYESLPAMARAVIELDQDEQRYLAMLQQPFFPGNQLPAVIIDIRRNFDRFLDRALNL